MEVLAGFGSWSLASQVINLRIKEENFTGWNFFRGLPPIKSGRHFSQVRCLAGHANRAKLEVSASATHSKDLNDEAVEWAAADADVGFLTRTVRLVQWYPGHIAKAERSLKEHLKLVDVVLEVRDARIPLATTHPELEKWVGERVKVLVMNREDMVSAADKRAWQGHFSCLGQKAYFTDSQHGAGIVRLQKAVLSVGKEVNGKRKEKGLLPRKIRAAVIGYPNVGKSALINRLVNRRACKSAPRPGVTRELNWVKVGEELELLDAPGILPARVADQAAAARLAICNDIGEAAYAAAGVGAILVEMLKRMPSAGPQVLTDRYKLDATRYSGEELLVMLADKLFQGDVDVAARRILKDYRTGYLGKIALERPPSRVEFTLSTDQS